MAAAAVRVKGIPRTFVVNQVKNASMPTVHPLEVLSVRAGMSSPLHLLSDNPRQRHKADVSVDTVNTLPGTTNCPAALFIMLGEPRTKIRKQSLRGHAVPITPDHELVLDTHA